MWYEIFKFEIKYRLKRLDTYIFFAFLFLFSLAGVDFVFGGIDLGPIKMNSPIVIAKTMGAITGIFMMIASMVMGVPVLRDFEHKIEPLVFINPIKKRDYLLGKFLGSFAILLIIFSSVLLGIILGDYMPWRNPNDLMPFYFWTYLQPFLYVGLPTLFFGASLFFVTGALSRKLIVVYTQGVIFFVVFILNKAIKNEFIQAVLDPFSLTTITEMTEFWTVAERNSQPIPFDDVLLYNKIFWSILGVIILILGYYKFNFNVVKSKVLKKSKQLNYDGLDDDSNAINSIPSFILQQSFKSRSIQLIQHSLFYFKSITKTVSFWSIVICGVIIILINSINLGTVYGVDSFPTTYLIVEELQEMSLYFFIIILVFYSGELIWKERDSRLNLIYDAVPISDLLNLLGKLIGLSLTYVLLMLVLILSGIAFQTFNGYYKYELDVYFYGFFIEIFPFLILYTFIAFIFQIMTNNKFIGHIATIAFFIITIALELLGYGHDLYSFGGNSLGTYSDMNGYGHFMLPYILIKTYWLIFCTILFTIAATLTVRGTETSFKKRWKLSKSRFTKSQVKTSIISFVIFALLGSYIYYNTNILNQYWTKTEQLKYRAGYEKSLKKFEYLPQPKIVNVNLKVELYPSTRSYTAEGYYILVNKENIPIQNIHVQKLIESRVAIEYITFGSDATLDKQYMKYDYHIYILKKALQPGDSIKMKFKQTLTTKGFEESGSNSKVVNNGTFFNNKDFPTLGYNKKYELTDEDDRETFGLAPRKGMVGRDHKVETKKANSGNDADKINFEIVIGTYFDQTAIAPGNLQKQWTKDNRNYFHYKMDKPMVDFYAIVSARYEVKKGIWAPTQDSLNNPVALEIYYHKGHEYNLDRMMEAMKMSFDYYSTNFSPYQYQQMRIMEFPRYAEFAQSFPNTVPFSESIGFMLDINDETDVDMAFYITAHELAHQWWGLQVMAANVQGRHMILETLAQYSALMVMRQKYPEEKIQQFLSTQLESYFKGRVKEKNQEFSLELVENQDYIYYRKGAINMYALQDYISEENVNLALKKFVKDWNIYDGKLAVDRYPTTIDLLSYFNEVTPKNKQYIITDLFETITHYENKTINAEYVDLKDDRYKVDLALEAMKLRTDSLGIEKSVELNDWIDIGIYSKSKNGKDELIYLKKHKIINRITELEIIVNKKPIRAGIDPINKLIDKNGEDNQIILSELID